MAAKKEVRIYLRLTESEKANFQRASELEGIDLSTWARQLLRKETVKTLSKHGEKANF